MNSSKSLIYFYTKHNQIISNYYIGKLTLDLNNNIIKLKNLKTTNQLLLKLSNKNPDKTLTNKQTIS